MERHHTYYYNSDYGDENERKIRLLKWSALLWPLERL
jgi:hypothetical protein